MLTRFLPQGKDGGEHLPVHERYRTSLSGFFSEAGFHDLLSIERKRAERSKKVFMLLLLDIRSFIPEKPKKAAIKKLFLAVKAASREIDLKGWYEHGRVLGIIYTEVLPEGREKILEKLESYLLKAFPETRLNRPGISTVFFPSNNSPHNSYEEFEHLYPELIDSSPVKAVSLAVKRAIDIAGSVFGLVLFFPFFIIIPLAIKATSKGPVLYRQQRVGLGGKSFTFLKFRSMFVNNDPSIHLQFIRQHIRGPSEQKVSSETDGQKTQMFKMVNDPRVTPLGRFLRKTSLDELPQLINVLLGNMSLVGPRPAIPYEVREYASWHLQRIFPVKPGITGVWQVEGRSSTTFDTMVRMDIQYIKNWSVFVDLKLIFKTPFSVLAAKGAC